MVVVSALTIHLSSTQTPPGKGLSNGGSSFWVSHNMSNTGSSKFLQQRASATAVVLAPDATSSPVTSLSILSTLKHVCIGTGGRVQLWTGGARNKRQLTVNAGAKQSG